MEDKIPDFEILTSNFKEMDKIEKAALQYFKEFPQSGVITYRI